MADDATLPVSIEVDTGGGAGEIKSIVNALANMQERVDKLGDSGKNLSSSLERAQRQAAALGQQAKTAEKNVASLSRAASEFARQQALKAPMSQAAASTDASNFARQKAANLDPSPAQQKAALAAYRAQNIEIEKQKKALADTLAIHYQIAKQAANTAQQTKRMGSTWVTPGLNSAADNSMTLSAQRQAQIMSYQKQYNAEMGKSAVSVASARNALESYNDRLANTRYALYGLTTALAVGGAALLAMNISLVKIAADMETMQASIERTSGVSGTALTNLENDFISLGQTIPASFKDIGTIATLAGQLNIPAARIADFSETVAQFTATTDVTVDSAATAFGRLDALLPDVMGNYKALGSSILNVGVNSVATESAIIATTTQIAAAGAQAGFTADQIIGLSASFASLGIAPESARGTTIRVLSEIRTAVNQGGVELEKFAALAGTTADQFKAAWGKDAGAAFVDVLAGLQKEGAGAEDVLRGLGITAVRDLRALLALSQNVEIVADNFGYAAEGFSEATKLGDSFAIIAETLNAKLQVLVNSLQAMFAAMGGSGLSALSGIVTGLTEFTHLLTDIAATPGAQALLSLAGVITGLSAIVLLATSGFGRMIAAILAGRPVSAMFSASLTLMSAKMNVVTRAANVAGVSLNKFQVAAIAAGTGAKVFAASVLPVLAITAAIAVVATVWDGIANSLKSAGDVAKERVGDFSALRTALVEDTKAADGAQHSFETIAGSVTKTSTETAEWVKQVERATGAQVQLSSNTEETSDSIENQTFIIGKNAQVQMANILAQDEAVQGLVVSLNEMGQAQLANQFLGALIKGDIEEATRLRDIMAGITQEAARAKAFSVGQGAEYNTLKTALDNMDIALKTTSGSYEQAAIVAETYNAVQSALGSEMNLSTEAIDEFGTAASDAKTRIQELNEAISNAFSTENILGAFADDFSSLMEAVAEGGVNSFNYLAAGGKANMDALQTSIASTIYAAESVGIDATQAVAALFLELRKQGIDTAALLASLSGKSLGGGVKVSGIQDYLSGTKQMSGASADLSQIMGGLATQANKAAAGTRKAGGAAKAAAADVKTLGDYAKDLSGVFSRAFTIQFGGEQALDKLTSSWLGVAEATETANKAFRDAQVTLQGLQSKLGDAQYFLSVAEDYGDVLRADEIRAEIADLNAQIADEQKKSADAQADASKELLGNSKAAVQNRNTILGLVNEYEDYLSALASSGMSQAELQAKSAQLRSEFVNQATQAGFSGAEIEKYAATFDGMALAIARVPRNITVAANVNPAIQALLEFEAAAARAGANAGSSISNGIAGAGASMIASGRGLADAFRNSFQNEMARKPVAIQGYLIQGSQVYNVPGTGLKLFKTGGYTGDGGTGSVVGAVHGKEFVVDASNTARLGLPFLNALNAGRTPAVSAPTGGMPSIMQVELSPYDRQLLAAAGNVTLSIGDKVIANATNSANGVNAHRGHR